MAGFGWREWLVVAVVLLACYAIWAVLRLRRLDRSVAAVSPRQEPAPAADAGNAAEPPPAWNEPPPRFAERQIVLSLERQLIEMREELDALRGAFAALREETQEAIDKAKLTQNISPLYGDAMQMALAGETADTIAARCGVARAEAELVVAMVNRAQGELGDDDPVDDNQLSFDGFDDLPRDGFADFSERYSQPPTDDDYPITPLHESPREEPWLKS